MRAFVTGAAGFIGSTLCESLIAAGHEVTGVDAFTDYYSEEIKRSNIANVLTADSFRLVELDLRTEPIEPLLAEAEVVFHLAAQPGVRRSWDEFEIYVNDNVLVTQRMLEAARTVNHLDRFVYASSSSVYGESKRYPTREDDPLRPHSPYGVSKLAGEQLCVAYAENFALPTVALRYFTVYGPRQRPDMAFFGMCDAIATGKPFNVFGDGTARRNFTFVADVVKATALAGSADLAPGTVLNIAGTTDVTLRETLNVLGEIAGTDVPVVERPSHAGDVRRTGGSIDLAAELLGWEPRVGLREGLTAQLRWHQDSKPSDTD